MTPLTTLADQTARDWVARAFQSGTAIPAFNIPYLPMMEPVVRALRATDTAGFVMVARLEWIKFESGGPEPIRDTYLQNTDAEHVRLHLDHIPVIDEDELVVDYLPLIREALELGYDSVMIDGSRLAFEANVAATRSAAELAHAAGVPIEAELGAVMGHESGPRLPYDELFASGKGFTDVGEARRFVEESGCDWLSVAIGNVHGAVAQGLKDQKKVAARLNLEHLEALKQAAGVPLVLHGGSGIQQAYVLESFRHGIAKINIATEIRQAWEQALRESGRIEDAIEAVYARTCTLMTDYYKLAGNRAALLAATVEPSTP